MAQLCDGVIGIALGVLKVLVVPGIFADGDTDSLSLIFPNGVVVARLEISGFIKNIVGG